MLSSTLVRPAGPLTDSDVNILDLVRLIILAAVWTSGWKKDRKEGSQLESVDER